MKVLVIPTTDWIRHPVPNRLNFIFDILAEDHEIYVMHFRLKRFKNLEPRRTKCRLVDAGRIEAEDPSLFYLLNFPYHFGNIKKLIETKNIDAIVSTNILPSFAANFAGAPIIFDYLDHLEESASIYYPGSAFGEIVRKGVSLITRFNLLHASSVITVTEELSQFLNGVGVREITVIPNGVDTSILEPIPIDEAKKALNLRGKVLGYVGSLEHWVDLETVIRALPSLDAKLLVVGPGLFTDYGNMIKKLAEKLDVGDKVIFTGAIKYSELSKYISAMDIGLNPLKKMKKNEYAAGGKVFNYLSCGRPVLSSRGVSLENLLDDQIFFYDDEKSFVERAKEIFASKNEEERYRSIAKRYDWHILARRYEDVLKKAI